MTTAAIVIAIAAAWVASGAWRTIRDQREWREIERHGSRRVAGHERAIVIIGAIIIAIALGPLLWLKESPLQFARRRGFIR